MIGRGLMEKVINGKRDERVYICEQEFALFAMYYFAEFFTYAIPGFQWVMYKLLNEFTRGKFRFLLWVMFRESAKTTITKIYVIYCIVYRKKRFINWDAYDKGNSESALFDIATWLQTNKRLIADFGQLYFEEAKAKSQSQMKRVAEFVTSNRIKVKAYSTQESTRGRIFDRFRPDLYIMDDFETFKTIESVPVTEKIIKHMDELKTGLSVDGQVIYLCNLITENGIVARLILEAKENTDSWRSQMVGVEDEGNAWPDKYVVSNEELAGANAGVLDPKEYKVSLEQKKKDLNSGGRKVYEAEMLNNPEASGESFFNREKVDKQIAIAKLKKPLKTIGECNIWELYNPKHRYGFGADTAKGVGRDSCASVGIRFKTSDTAPAMVCATYASNTIAPDIFAYELDKQGSYFGQCILAPEINNTGYATVTQLKALKYPKMYRKHNKDESGVTVTDQLGWEATSNNVADIYYAFRTAYEDGEVIVLDMGLLVEMRQFNKRDLHEASKRTESSTLAGVTRHFDKLRAACIAWEMRHHATVGRDARKPYRQGEVPRVSEYQG